MQNISKYTNNRHLFLPRQLLNSVIYRDIKEEKILSDKILKFLSKPSNSRLLNNFSYQTIFHIQQKCPTLCSLFLMNNKLHDRIFERSFSTSSSARNIDNKSKSSSEKEPKDPDQDQRQNANDQRAALIKLFIVSAFVYGLFVYPLRKLGGDTVETVTPFISWNEFVHQMLAKGEVQEIIVKPELDWVTVVLHEGAVVKGNKTKMRVYHMVVADGTRLEEKLREAEHSLGVKEGYGVPIVYERGTGMFEMGFIIAAVGYLLFMMMKKGKSNLLPKDLFGNMTRAKYTLVDPLTGGSRGVKFADVAGLKEAKIEVMEVVDYLKRPEHYKTLGAKVPKGALLLGPPGCGKTMLAKAVATEANVPFLSMNGSEFIEMIGGLGAARVRDLFEECRKRSPSILYIDEIDAIGKKRSGSSTDATSSRGTSESEQTLNQLLVEMDGMASKDGVIVIASTNRAEVLDKALLRPGRFDRHILIDLPTLPERKEIFERHLKSIVLDKKPENYSPRLAQLTPGFSGADIANICNEAALHAARFVKKSVDSNDLTYAIDRVLCGPEKKDHGISPTEKKIVAYHEAGHALVAWLLEETDALLKVTIKPRTRGSLGFAQYTPTERKNYSKEVLTELMCTALGGRAAENIIFKSVTTGAQNDLDRVTKIAYALVRQFGMSKEVGLLSFTEEETSLSQKKPFSKKLKNIMDAEVRQIVGDAYKKTEKILNDNLDKLEMIAEALLKQETLTYEEVEAMIGPPPFGQKKKVDFIDIDVPVAVSVETTSNPSSSSSSNS